MKNVEGIGAAAKEPSLLKRGARHLHAVDGLRAFAVLTVLAFHLKNSVLPGGFTGVDVFFVISGYVVSLALLSHTAERFASFLSAFYLRRTARIYPALIVVLLTTVVLSCLFIPRVYLSNSNDATGSLAFWGLSNWGLVNLNDNYFSPTTDFNPYTHTWSLAVEEQFYLVFSPIFFLVVRSFSNARYRWAAFILPALCLGSLIYSAWVSIKGANTAYYYLPSRFWELGTGAMLLQAHVKGWLLPRTVVAQGRWAIAAMVLLIVSVVFANARIFPFPWALPAVLGTALFISAAAASSELGESETPILVFFARPPVVFVGLISYSLYLWHWPLIVLARWTYGLQGISYALVALLSLALAGLSYKLVEGPIKRLFRKTACPGLALAVSLVAIWGCQWVYSRALDHQPRLSRSVTKGPDWHVNFYPAEGLAADSKKAWGAHSVYVLGDSHSAAYSEMMSKVNKLYGPHVRLFFKPGCPIANLREQTAKADSACRNFVSESFDQVVKLAKSGDVVFLAALRADRLGDQWAVFTEKDRFNLRTDKNLIADRAMSFKETDEILARFDRTGVTVVMDAPPPLFPSPAFRCADWYDRNNPVCQGGTTIARDFFEGWRRPTMDALIRLRQRHPHLVIWDPLDALCPSSTCSAFEPDGRPLFFDGDHLSGHGNEVVTPSFVKMLSRLWGSPLVAAIMAQQ